MIRVVLLVDYFDRVREFSFVKELAKRVELKVYTEKAASEAETAERLRDADIVIAFRDRVIYNRAYWHRWSTYSCSRPAVHGLLTSISKRRQNIVS